MWAERVVRAPAGEHLGRDSARAALEPQCGSSESHSGRAGPPGCSRNHGQSGGRKLERRRLAARSRSLQFDRIKSRELRYVADDRPTGDEQSGRLRRLLSLCSSRRKTVRQRRVDAARNAASAAEGTPGRHAVEPPDPCQRRRRVSFESSNPERELSNNLRAAGDRQSVRSVDRS